MPTTPTFDRLCAMLLKDYKLAPDQLTPDAPLEAIGIDSLGIADLLFTLEDEFKISLPPEPVQLLTLGDVAQFIDRLAAAQHSAGDAAGPPSPAAPPGTLLSPAP